MCLSYLGCVKTQTAGTHPQSFSVLGWGPGTCMSNKFPGEVTAAADLEITRGEPLIQSPVLITVSVRQNREPQDTYGLLLPTALLVCKPTQVCT